MHLSRYVRFILTMIVIGICVLILTQLGLPRFAPEAAVAEASTTTSRLGSNVSPVGGAVSQERAWATRPLRWVVSNVQENIDATNATFCSTVVSVLNMTNGSVTVEVEWTTDGGPSRALVTRQIFAHQMYRFATDDEINLQPFAPQSSANLKDMSGYARVHSTEHRILASAALVCRDGTASDSNLLVLNAIATTPIGNTMEFFRAGMPAPGEPQQLADPEPTR